MLLIVAALAVLFVVVFGRAAARFYVDALWFDGVGMGSVFWTTLRAKVLLFVSFFGVFAVLAGGNLLLADKLAPTFFPANVHPYVERFHEVAGRRSRLYRYVAAGGVGVLMALPAVAQWEHWMLFRHHQRFGVSDSQFNVDVGFYVFRLPFLSFVVNWLLLALVVVLIAVIVTHVVNGSVVFAKSIPSVSTAMSAHVAVLLATLAAVKAADYWLGRYEATNVSRGIVQGPTYAVVNGQLPALLLLAVVGVVVAGLFSSTLRTRSWRIPVVACAIWLVTALLAGIAYPTALQSLVVRPNQRSREAPYIERNVYATRRAMNIAAVNDRALEISPLSTPGIEADRRPLENIRLLNPGAFLTRFESEEGLDAGFAIEDLDVDRYDLGDEIGVEQVLIAAKELDLAGIPNRSWQGRHLISTRGCGLVMAPASKSRDNGQPDYRDVPLERPELYFSPAMTGYAVVGTDQAERACESSPNTGAYEGERGIELSSFWRRAAFGLAFMDYNLIGSGAIGSDSQLLWVRGVSARVEKLAPFLTFDGDPYPVVVDGGVKWVVDAYTASSRYPEAEAVGSDIRLSEQTGIPRSANYVRNSVKAVVDAYDGSVVFYVMGADAEDPSGNDPIIGAWRSAFPALFADADTMPAELRDHLRYPEDLFRVQTSVYSKYQLDPAAFFERDGAWSVAQSPDAAANNGAAAPAAEGTDERSRDANDFLTEPATNRFVPYYTLFANPDGVEEFVLFRPFVPFSADDRRTELQAYMTASGEFDSYGELRAYLITGSPLPFGPQKVATDIASDPEISTQVTLLSRAGSTQVRYGDLQVIPIGGSLLYARPIYTASAAASGVEQTHYRFIIIYYNGTAAFAPTIEAAVQQLFPLYEGDIGELVATRDIEDAAPPPDDVVIEPDGGPAPSTVPASGPGPTPGTVDAGSIPADATAADLIALAEERFAEADAALRDGDLSTYQLKVDEASQLVAAAGVLLGDAPPATAGTAGTGSTSQAAVEPASPPGVSSAVVGAPPTTG